MCPLWLHGWRGTRAIGLDALQQITCDSSSHQKPAWLWISACPFEKFSLNIIINWALQSNNNYQYLAPLPVSLFIPRDLTALEVLSLFSSFFPLFFFKQWEKPLNNSSRTFYIMKNIISWQYWGILFLQDANSSITSDCRIGASRCGCTESSLFEAVSACVQGSQKAGYSSPCLPSAN